MYKTENYIFMNTQHVFFFILEGCILLSVAVGTGMYYRRVIRGKHRTMYRLIREQEFWKREWGILMRHLELLELYSEHNVETWRAASPSQPNSAQQQLVVRLNHYILNDCNFSLHNDLSAFLSINGDTLSEAVKAVTGKTLPDHVNRLRLEKARQLLKKSE